MHMNTSKPLKPALAHLMRVNGLAEIEFLVKESEVLTGRAGRIFVICGADKLTYRVLWHPLVVEIERLNDAGAVVAMQRLSPHAFAAHSIVEALVAGQLYTMPVANPH